MIRHLAKDDFHVGNVPLFTFLWTKRIAVTAATKRRYENREKERKKSHGMRERKKNT